jgi:hypothetical protein
MLKAPFERNRLFIWLAMPSASSVMATSTDRGSTRSKTTVARRWQFGRLHAYRLITGAKVAYHLVGLPNTPPPANERQVRPLVGLNQSEARTVWKKAVNAAGNNPVTGKIVAETRARLAKKTAAPHSPPEIWQENLEFLLRKALRLTRVGDRSAVDATLIQMSLHLEIGRQRHNPAD